MGHGGRRLCGTECIVADDTDVFACVKRPYSRQCMLQFSIRVQMSKHRESEQLPASANVEIKTRVRFMYFMTRGIMSKIIMFYICYTMYARMELGLMSSPPFRSQSQNASCTKQKLVFSNGQMN
jgi:hypothetical protein